jgi:YspA, cpYpsA-related SLOG family
VRTPEPVSRQFTWPGAIFDPNVRGRQIAGSAGRKGRVEIRTLRVLVCGGRDWRNAETIESALNSLHAGRGPFARLMHGGARGVDRIAGRWARKNGILEWDFLPEWHRAGTPDGPARNQRMIAEGAPDLVVAFPGGLGTADMVDRAKAAGIEVIETLARSS